MQQAFDAAGHVVVERRLSDVVDATGTPSCRRVVTRHTYNARPEIEASGAVVVGLGEPAFPGGTRIPPTKVEIVRPPS